MKTSFELAAEFRDAEGKGASRRLRRANKVPAILYGGHREPRALALDHTKLMLMLDNERFYSTIINIKVGDVVLCLPKDLPEYVDVDLSGLDMNQMLHLADLKMPEGVEIPELTHGRNAPVVSIHHARAEEVEAPSAEAGAVAAAPAAAAAPPAAAKPAAEAKGKDAKK
jgi:ribosomal protein L25 (general stress protein Ctc)